eukprot:4640978-Prymnesium_polylepis.1
MSHGAIRMSATGHANMLAVMAPIVAPTLAPRRVVAGERGGAAAAEADDEGAAAVRRRCLRPRGRSRWWRSDARREGRSIGEELRRGSPGEVRRGSPGARMKNGGGVGTRYSASFDFIV